MSVFTLRDLWTYDCPDAPSPHSFKCLNICNVDNDESGDEKIIVGSSSGFLRFISNSNENGELTNNNQANLLAEVNLGHPILQVSSGYFVGSSPKLHLAVLQPLRLGVYSMSKLNGQVEHGTQYEITLLYEHKLKRHAFNMTIGPFGQNKSGNSGPIREKGAKFSPKLRDFICIQSLDGTLSFYEQDLFSFSAFLPYFLLPGPLAYNCYTSSFLTINSAHELHSFRYSSLSSSKKDGENNGVGRKLEPDWSFSIGEEIVGEISVLNGDNSDNNEGLLIILSFRSIFCMSGTGELVWTKRLDFYPTAYHAYLNELNECMSLVCSESGALYVFNGTGLKWAARLPFPTPLVSRLKVRGVPGGIVLISSDGRVSVNALGTQPPIFTAPPIEPREIDIETAQRELVELRKIIAEASSEDSVPLVKETTVEIKLEFEGQKSVWSEKRGEEILVLISTVKIFCHSKVNDVRVTISTPLPIHCSEPSVYIGDIVGRHNYSVEFSCESGEVPSDLELGVNLYYATDAGSPHVVQKTGTKLPLFIIVRPWDRVERECECKLTFSLDKQLISLMSLYNDFEWNAETNASALTFLFNSGEKVTILSSAPSKSAENSISRYRIQSNSLPPLHLILRDFLDRISRKFGRGKSNYELKLISGPSQENEFPLIHEFFREIDEHLLRRRRESQINEDLGGRAAQFRGVQRRLLLRYRDKNILPLSQLEKLLDGSLDQIFDTLSFMEQNLIVIKEKQKSECRLSGSTRLMLLLIQILNPSLQNDSNFKIFSNALSPHIFYFSTSESGWEESLYSSLIFIKSGQIVPPPKLDALDVDKFKKLIKTALEKWKKGGKMHKNAQKETKNERGGKIEEEGKVEGQLGTEIGERMMSGRGMRRKKSSKLLDAIIEPSIDDGGESETVEENNLLIQQNGERYSLNSSIKKNTFKDIDKRRTSASFETNIPEQNENNGGDLLEDELDSYFA